MSGRIKLIANPVAGRQAETRIRQATALLESVDRRVDLTLTRERGHARRLAAEARGERYDRIVVAGGDGTLNEVINGLAPSKVPVGLIPLGTTNVFALEAGIPHTVEGACNVALNGIPTPVCLGQAGETRFLQMAGIGFDAEAVLGVSSRLKRLTGKGAYVASAVAALVNRPPRAVEVSSDDGQVFKGYTVIIGNGRLYGGRFSVTPRASHQEDYLEVCVFLKGGRFQMLRYALRVAMGRHRESDDVRIFRTSALEVTGSGVPVQIDGDFLGRLPMSFRAAPGEVTLLLPRRS